MDENVTMHSDLSRVESDCYRIKDENADLHNTIKRVESRATDSVVN